jgi:hypothetical protein
MASIFLYVYDAIDSYKRIIHHEGYKNKFEKIFDFKAYYYKTKAPQPFHHEINLYNYHQLSHPISSYFNKEMPQKMSIFSSNILKSSNKMMFSINISPEYNFANDYILRDFKKMLMDPNTKLIFVDNLEINKRFLDKCIVGYLEYYFLDGEIKSYFTQNYRFENRLISPSIQEIFRNKKSLNSSQIYTDIDLYVRKN